MVKYSVEEQFKKSKLMLIQYIKENEKNPTEKQWDKYAIIMGYLSSRSMGYLDGDGFNIMCKKIRKSLKNAP